MIVPSRRNLLRTGIVALIGGTAGCVASAPEPGLAVVAVAPPPLREEVIPVLPPERRSVEYWHPGHWRWNGREYVWVPGRYVVRPRPAAVWVAPRWERRGSGWVFIEGRWT